MGGSGGGSGSCRFQGPMGAVGGEACPQESSLMFCNWGSDEWA